MIELAFNIFTIVNLTVLASLLFFRKHNSVTNRILAVIIFLPSINFLNNIFILQRWIILFPHILFISQISAQIYIPLIYVYINYFIGKKNTIKNPLYIFTLFIIVIIVVFWIEYMLLPSEQKEEYINQYSSNTLPIRFNFYNGLMIITGLTYLLTSLINVKRFIRRARDFYSEEEKIKLGYILKFILIVISLSLLLLIFCFLLSAYAVKYIIIPLSINFIYLYVLYNAIRHSALFSHEEFNKFANKIQPIALDNKNITKEKEKLKSNYHISEELANLLQRKIEVFFSERRPYLNPNFHIENLAHELKVGKHHLSYIINSRFQQSFFELVNSYRVMEAKKRLKDMSKLQSVDSIGYEVGFNTKSAFYRAFKKHANLTPAKFLLKQEENQ